MREKQFNMRLNEEEAARLDLVSKHYDLSNAAVFRMLLKQRHDDIVNDQPKLRAVPSYRR